MSRFTPVFIKILGIRTIGNQFEKDASITADKLIETVTLCQQVLVQLNPNST